MGLRNIYSPSNKIQLQVIFPPPRCQDITVSSQSSPTDNNPREGLFKTYQTSYIYQYFSTTPPSFTSIYDPLFISPHPESAQFSSISHPCLFLQRKGSYEYKTLILGLGLGFVQYIIESIYHQMNEKSFLRLLLLFQLALVAVYAANNEVAIYSVSSSLNSYTVALGSKGGGTTLYISGNNFSPNADEIQILIGPYPCNLIAQGSTVSMVSCVTTPMTNSSSFYALPITMYTTNLLTVTCSTAPCLFNYQDSLTPYIVQVFPNTAVGNQQIAVDGYHRILNIGDGRSPSAGDLRYFLVDSVACSTLDIIQDAITGSSENNIYCNTFTYQEAGEFALTERTAYGDAIYSFRAIHTSLLSGLNFTVRIAPTIDSSTASNIPHAGGTNGHILTLPGTGFAKDPANLTSFTCNIGQVKCSVIYTSQASIQVQLPPYQAGYETAGALPQDPADSSVQTSGFLGSFGFKSTRYSRNTFKDLGLLVYDFRAGNSSQTITSEGYATQLGNINNGVSNFIDYLRGYFYAPVAGDYLFETTVDDNIVVYISKYQNNSNPLNMNMILRVDNYIYTAFDPYYPLTSSNVITLTLAQGYYYMQVIARDIGSGNFYYVSMSMPPTPLETKIKNPTYQEDNIILTPTNIIPEVITVAINSTEYNKNYILFYYTNSGGTYTKISSSSITVGVIASKFLSSLSGLSDFTSYSPTVTLSMLDATNTTTTDTNLAIVFVYSISFTRIRSASATRLFSCNVTTGIKVATTQNHSAGLGGTYTISLSGVLLSVWDSQTKAYSTSIQISNSIGYIQDALKSFYKLPSLSELVTISRSTYQYPDQLDFNIIYNQVISPLPMVIDTTGLTGGADNVFTATITTKRAFGGDRPYFQSVPFELLRMASAKPTLDIRYNKVPAICLDCSYVYASTEPISITSAAFKANNAGLNLVLSASDQSIFSTLSLTDVTIALYGQPCVVDAGSTLLALACTFNTGANSIPLLPAGNDVPLVHIRQLGFLNVDASLKLLNDITIASITPLTLGFNGGVTITMTGTGFPLDAKGPTLKIKTADGNPADVTDYSLITNQQVKFSFPPVVADALTDTKSSQIIIQLHYANYIYSFSDTNTFSFNRILDPTVTALSIQSASPIVKQNLVVTGTNFDLSASNMNVFLYFAGNLTKKYQLGILSVASQTEMTVVLGGGRSGNYYLRVEILGKGMSGPTKDNFFAYEIVVDSISPATGSIGGGYTMTITGKNFATASGTTQIFLGDRVGDNGENSLCSIQTITTTMITCTVPQMISGLKVGDNLGVVVAGRLIEISTCTGSCNFVYEDTDTVFLITPAVTVFASGSTVTVQSNNSDISLATVTVGSETVTLLTANNDTITFAYPSFAAGTYPITVTVNGGYAYPIIKTSTVIQFNSISSASGSNKGQFVSVIGNGFSNINDQNNIVYYICGISSVILPIASVTHTNITFEVPSNPTSTCKLNVTMGNSFHLYNYAQSAGQTPFITVTDQGSSTYQIVVSGTSKAITFIVARYLDSNSVVTTTTYPMTWTNTATNQYSATPAGGYLPCGTFVIAVHFATQGFADSSTNTFSIYDCTTMKALSPAPISVSFGGHGSYQLIAPGFITDHINNNEIRICGMRANVTSANQDNLIFDIPAFVNSQTSIKYGLGSEQVLTPLGSMISDMQINPGFAFDSIFRTVYTSSNSFCYIGLDFGADAQANITKIRYVPNTAWITLSRIFNGAAFKGSNDGTTWTTIFAIDPQQVHTGWNVWLSLSQSTVYRYVRFEQNGGSSQCQLAELEVTGTIYSTTPYSPTINCDIEILFNDPSQTITLSGAVSYQDSMTAVIASISPSFGPSTGNTLVTITGTNFDPSSTVTIDGITCVVSSATSTEIQCTTGVRAQPPTGGNSFVVVSAGNAVILDCPPYAYMDRWSAEATWGGEVPPRDGDMVVVPQGMTLLVDQSTPFLNMIMVEGGTVVFSDESDITVDANYFIFIGGQFRAGLEDKPYQHKLTITLHGGYYDKQLPYFGNKVLGCMNCKFNMHGIVRNPTWTELNQTANPGDNLFSVIAPVDWQVGESVAVAATGYNHYETEQKTITAVSTDKKTITVDTPFVYRHFAAIERIAGQDFIMRAEVGLLTRNIVIQGDDMTEIYDHGSHLIFMGSTVKGLQAAISYTEIRQCGQPKIIARYCSHFHMAGEVPNSFVRGLAVHHSHARVLTIHGTHYLLVEKNVGYNVHGHNIFIEDGIQTHNIIQDNLMMSAITSLTLLQSDTSVASYWITNPSNTVRRNHAAGSDFYGFWYEIKAHPDGPSATANICPPGMPLGESSDNVAHSNRRFGLRIFNYAARQYPCLPIVNESLVNPFDYNPVFESVFKNYMLWKNQEAGLLAQQLGFATFDSFRIIDSGATGMQFYKTNISLQNVTAQNSIIVGYSTGNAPADIDTTLVGVRGIITPRTDGFRATNITFVNFGATMTPFKACSKCENILLWVTGGKTSFFNNITYQNILGNYIFWNKWRREIFIDEDGTLTAPIAQSLGVNQNQPGAVTPYFPHLDIANHCYHIQTLWDNTTFCDKTITLRSLLYTNADPLISFTGVTVRTFRLASPTDSDDSNLDITIQPMIIIKKSHDISGSWAMPYAIGQYYHIHFEKGIDFLHMSLAPSQYWQETEGMVLRFNYTDQRQLFEISHYYSQQKQTPFITPSTALIDPATCNSGDYYHDQMNRQLFTCISGRNKTLREWIDITGVRCRNFCPKAAPFGTRETFNRLWSNVTQWPNKVLPKEGDNVTIPYEWNIVLDMSPPEFYYVHINGLLYFDDTQDLTFKAYTIWVDLGGIYIGTAANPYQHQATITLNGGINDLYTVIDPDASGNKMLAVTGALEFYGKPLTNIWTRLAAIGKVGDTSITVLNATEWNVGNEIVIGATYTGYKEDEVFQITGITGNVLTLNASLIYEHYGDPQAITNSHGGVIDVRAAVGMLSRNIKITKGSTPSDWGCKILVYSYIVQIAGSSTPPTPVNGYIIFDGVEVDGCGQYDTDYAAIRIQKLGSLTPATQDTVITHSSIRNSNGFGLYIDTSANITIDNNVFHNSVRYTAYVLKVNNYTFTHNALIGLRNRTDIIAENAGTGLAPDNAAYEQWVSIKFGTDHVLVTGNLVQGAMGQGFVFPFTSCALISTYPFAGNTAGTCVSAFVINVSPGFTCLAASGLYGYSSVIGLMANPPGLITQLIYENMFFTDNQRGITLRYAHEHDDNSIILRNSYFMGYSRPNCPSCYSDTTNSYCQNGYAVRMFAATLTGQAYPNKKLITGFDVICTQQAFDGKSFLTNVTFENYQNINENLPYCNSMNVFKRHDGASDATGVHHLYQSPCINCDLEALVYFDPPNPKWSGWDGGCGELACTGPINYFIHDHDGYFTQLGGATKTASQLMANNQPIGDNQPTCSQITAWNGYWCKTQSLAVLEYQSIAADFNTRVNWPIYLQYDGGSWNSTTNAWKEWSWNGPTPNNKRLARFWSIIVLNQTYNMTYSSMPPSDSVYQIQKRQLPSGNASDWAIVRIYFPVPNVVIVKVNNDTGQNIAVPSYPQKNGVYNDLTLSTKLCGANNYRFEKNIIEFVVNGINNCQVRLTLSSYLQLTTRFDVDLSTFYTNNGEATILTKIAAFLNIDPAQIKIVSINTGSVIADFAIYPASSLAAVDVSSNATDPNNNFLVSPPADSTANYNELATYFNKFSSAVIGDKVDLGYPVLSVVGSVSTVETSGNSVTLCRTTFLYNSNTDTCYCDTGYANISNVCTDCSNLGNTTAKADSGNSSRCECSSTYIWDDTAIGCLCAANSIVDASKKCFQCTNLANSTGLVNTALTACQCNTTFTFQTNNTCTCPDFLSYVDTTGSCFSCANIGNATGSPLVDTKACQCNPTYVWSQATNSTACLCVADSIVDANLNCFLCTGLVNGTGIVSSADYTKCECNPTFEFQTNSSCICPDINSYINVAGSCIPCTGVANGTGAPLIAAKTCECNPTYNWYESVSTTACLCAPDSIVDTDGNCFLCTGLTNGTGKVSTSNKAECQCNTNMVFQANNNTCMCSDPSSYIDSTGTCIPCASISNGTGAPLIIAKACQCNPTYIWSQRTSTTACLCAANSIVDTNGNCFLCTGLTNSTGKVNAADFTQCQCNTNMVFQTNNNTCICADINSYIDSSGRCVPCTDVGNGTGIALIITKACQCTATYIWTPSTNTTACLCAANSIVDANGKCFLCTGLTNSTGKVSTTDFTQCQCNKNMEYQANNTCLCPDPISYIDSGTCYGCSKAGNGTGKVNMTLKVCLCTATYIWSQSATTCLCAANSIVDATGKCFSCTGLTTNSTGKVSTTNYKQCQCNTNLVFQANNTCICPDPNSYLDSGKCYACSNTGNGTGKANLTKKACICLATYLWNGTNNSTSCLCAANSIVDAAQKCFLCTGLGNSTGKVSTTNIKECQCNTNFVFQANNTCMCPDANSFIDSTGKCFPCTSILNGTGKANATAKACICTATYIWNQTANSTACLCAANSIVDASGKCFICTGLANSTGKVSTSNAKQCQCNLTFAFQANNTCICSDPSSFVDSTKKCFPCANIANGTGKANTTAKACICTATYVWNQTANSTACLCVANSIVDASGKCFLCTGLVNGTGKVNPTNSNQCGCNTGYTFQANNTCICTDPNSFVDSSKKCFPCSSIANGTGKANTTAKTCICAATYIWNQTANSTACLCAANSIIDASGKCVLCKGLTNGTGKINPTNSMECQCNPTFVFQANGTCTCSSPNSYVDASGKCVLCTAIGNGTGLSNPAQKACLCSATYVWNQTVSSTACLCPANNIVDPNQKCFSCASMGNGTKLSMNTTNDCQCNATFTLQTYSACACPDAQSYIDSARKCVGCSAAGNGTAKANVAQKACLCSPTYVWNQTISSTACLCVANSIVDTSGKCFLCTGLTNSTGKVNPTNYKQCQCNSTFAFQASNNTCMCSDPNSFIDSNGKCVICTGIGNGTGAANITMKKCTCTNTYVYNSTVNACLCPSAYFLKPTGICSQCPNNNCSCKTGLTFNPDTGFCACPANQASVNGACYSCINSNGTGKVLPNNECECLATFVFIKTSCQCSDNQSLIINSACVSCKSTNYNFSGVGIVTVNGVKQCACITQYTWIASTGTCICGVNSMLKGSTCYQCSQFSNTVTSTDSGLSQCVCINNLVFNTQSLACYCSDSNSILRQQTCVSCTSTTINGLARTNSTTCTCSSTLKLTWNSNTQTCICSSGYVFNGTQCLQCSTLSQSTATAADSISCVCKATYVWNPTTFSCACNSNSILFNGNCLNCDMYIGALTINTNTRSDCVCLGSLTWNAVLSICVCGANQIITYNGNCLTCNSATDSHIATANPTVDAYNCKCANPYFWDNIQNKCVSCTAAALPNALQKDNGFELSCSCASQYYFDVYTNKCVKTPTTNCNANNIKNCLDCSLIPQANTAYGAGVLTTGRYSNSKTTSALSSQYSKLTTSLGKYSGYQCYCQTGYTWEPTRKRCELVFV